MWEYQEYEYGWGICDIFKQIWQMNPLWTRGLMIYNHPQQYIGLTL